VQFWEPPSLSHCLPHLKTQNNHISPKRAIINPDSTLSDPHFFALFAVAKGGLVLVVSVGPVFVAVVIVELVKLAVGAVGLGFGVVVGSGDLVEVAEVGVEGVVGHGKT